MGTYRNHRRPIGQLCVEGDQACAQGDRIKLVEIAWDLVSRTGEPLHCELVPLADECADPERATEAWEQLKRKLA